MADIFISYAHEDQPFVRRIAVALEAEGFSVWWDHTIPPGKTWNTYIARGIEEAKACIVLWSEHSVASKWVMEEASLGNEAEKLLPVSIDHVVPPMGFRSMQAAQLQGWNGDTENPQWRLLANEARALVSRGGQRKPYVAPAAPRPAPQRQNWGLIGAGVALVVIAVALTSIALNQYAPPATQSASIEARDVTDVGDAAPAPAAEPAAPVSAAAPRVEVPVESAELDRLRRERDDALAAQRRAEDVANRPAPAPVAASIVGAWNLTVTWTGYSQTAEEVMTFHNDGRFTGSLGSTGSWTQNGDSVTWLATSGTRPRFDAVVTQSTMRGEVSGGNGVPGTFIATRR